MPWLIFLLLFFVKKFILKKNLQLQKTQEKSPRGQKVKLKSISFNIRKSFFIVSDQVKPKPACSATQISLNIEILHGASWTIVLSRYGIIKADCTEAQAGLYFLIQQSGFLSLRPIFIQNLLALLIPYQKIQ